LIRVAFVPLSKINESVLAVTWIRYSPGNDISLIHGSGNPGNFREPILKINLSLATEKDPVVRHPYDFWNIAPPDGHSSKFYSKSFCNKSITVEKVKNTTMDADMTIVSNSLWVSLLR
jgi:hypothetical protein